MLQLKKVLSLLCSVALVSATLVTSLVTVSAENEESATTAPTFSYGLRSSDENTTYTEDNKTYTYAILTCDGFTSNDTSYYTSSGTLMFKVTKDVFSTDVTWLGLGKNNKNGLVSGKKLPSSTVSVTNYDNNYDLLTVVWYGDNAYTTTNGDICELEFTTKSENFGDVEFIPFTENFNDNYTNIQLCTNDEDATTTQKITDFEDVDYKYTLSKDIITKTAISTTTTYGITKADATNGSFEVDKTTAAANDTVKITPSANEGYEVDKVTVTDTDVTKNGDTYSFTMPAKAVTVTVTFKEKWEVNSEGTFQKKEYTSDVAGEKDTDHAYAFIQKLNLDKENNSITAAGKYWLYAVTANGRYKYNKQQIELPNMTTGTIALGVVIQFNPENADNLFNPADVTGFELSVN